MRGEGVEAVVESDGFAIVGLAEIGRALPMFARAMRKLKDAAADRPPDAAILVDFPDFNLKLAKSLHKQGVKVIYYISPQLWAWRKYRISTIKQHVDLLITILPFEKEWYLRNGVSHVEYVGSPLTREVHPNRPKDEFCKLHNLDADKPIISLLPGSRHKEIVRVLPVMLEAATAISSEVSGVQFILALASGSGGRDVDEVINGVGAVGKLALRRVEDETYDALNASDAAAITSGTATLEAGIIGTPMVVVYKTSALNYGLLEPMIDVPHYGLINLIAEERVATELIQSDLTPSALSEELILLLDPEENKLMRGKLKASSDKLGHGGASARAAAAILKMLPTGYTD
jgi:lipid-A-disaccharide synthase